jgi:hypothetical protein
MVCSTLRAMMLMLMMMLTSGDDDEVSLDLLWPPMAVSPRGSGTCHV